MGENGQQSQTDLADLQLQLAEKIQHGLSLIEKLSSPSMKKVSGVAKLQKKVRQEVKFLEKFTVGVDRQDGTTQMSGLKNEHLQCSNLVHLSSVIHQLFRVKSPTSVVHPFNLHRIDGGPTKKLCVDIVCDGGNSWVKVVARNPKALDLNSQGGHQYGQRSILDQVNDLLKCAQQNQKLFRTPTVIIYFANGVTAGLARKITRKGAVVEGELVDTIDIDSEESNEDSDSSEQSCESDADPDDESLGEPSSIEDSQKRVDVFDGMSPDGKALASSNDHSQQTDVSIRLSDMMIGSISETARGENRPNDITLTADGSKINLDITAMIAYVSNLSNGRANFVFKEKILTEQASWERERPVKPFLDSVFEGKNLVCCESAYRDFGKIVNTLGGDNEKERADQLMKRLTVLPDQESSRVQKLDFCRKIKDRSRAIFGTGDNLRLVTLTANSGFVRAAGGQGVQLAVMLHESRALTENKERFATPIVANETRS